MARSRALAAFAALQAPFLFAAMAELWQGLWRDLFNPYHPEQHYMRGPGPAWQAKHAAKRTDE